MSKILNSSSKYKNTFENLKETLDDITTNKKQFESFNKDLINTIQSILKGLNKSKLKNSENMDLFNTILGLLNSEFRTVYQKTQKTIPQQQTTTPVKPPTPIQPSTPIQPPPKIVIPSNIKDMSPTERKNYLNQYDIKALNDPKATIESLQNYVRTTVQTKTDQNIKNYFFF